MRIARLPLVVTVGLAGAATAWPEEGWVRVRSPHFEVVTDAGPGVAGSWTARLEEFREVMSHALPPGRALPDGDVLVLALGEGRFDDVSPLHEGRPIAVDGFVQGGGRRPMLVVRVRSGRMAHREAAFHEYAHLVLNAALDVQPPWLSEGLADVYANWSVVDGRVVLGAARPEYLGLLRRRAWLPLRALLGVTRASATYNEGDDREVFYAESWALAHQLLLGGGAGAHASLARYLGEVATGVRPEDAFAAAFGRSIEESERALHDYLASGAWPVATLPAPSPFVAPPFAEAARAEVEYDLGDLMVRQGRFGPAEQHLRRSVDLDPAFAPAHEGLAHVALEKGRIDEARAHLERALARDPDDPGALVRWAESLLRSASARGTVLTDAERAEAVRSLTRAVARAPLMAEACDLLAQLDPHPHAARIAMLEKAWAANPDRATLGITLASLHLDAGDLRSASRALTRVRSSTRENHILFLSEHLLRRIRQFGAGIRETDAVLQALECPPGGELRFVLKTREGLLNLVARNAAAVLLYGPDGETHERTLVCGPLARAVKVRARYRAAGPGDGTVLALTFPEG